MLLNYLTQHPFKRFLFQPHFLWLWSVLFLIVCSGPVIAQTQDSVLSPVALKKLSLEDLMNIEVTSVSKRPEKLNEVSSAIQVITGEDIKRSGVKTLPEALKLVANIQIGQVNSTQWAISSRGFNNVLANKLLVLVDGRTVYTPMYAGVFWDVQNVMLEDVDRIEVISGPGGTLWGANAVNGVINIITKNSADTQGLFVEAAYGNTMPGMGSLRYGGKINDKISYRAYATGFHMGSTFTMDTTGSSIGNVDSNKYVSAKDEWGLGQGGVRFDWDASEKDKVMFQANGYYGDMHLNPKGDTAVLNVSGENALVRWNRSFLEGKGDFQLQVYFDHTWRDYGNDFTEDVKTYDVDWQNRYQMGSRHTLTYGLGYRLMDHRMQSTPNFGFFPLNKTLNLYNAFAQYEIMPVKDKLRFTVGSKIEHNTYTGFQYQPNVRLTWMITKQQTVWAAASRAVRNPARIDRDFGIYANIFGNPRFPLFAGTDTFRSETVMAYEAGWRFNVSKKLSVSVSGFYNVYDHLRSVQPGPAATFGFPLLIENGVKGESYGTEVAFNSQLTEWLSLRGGYTFFWKHLWVKQGHQDANNATVESNDPGHQALLQATFDLPFHFQFCTVARYVDSLTTPQLKPYCGLDARLAWKFKKILELSVTGQSLLYDHNTEFIADSPIRRMQRGVYGKIIFYLN
ncbi:MAG: TonB-dependent receptor [Bacteroidetes bacterium]|jgi:iron complex outermembrane receptor protein|nr:TonB-dependent receptor [Bacteroidota bacterium]